MVTRRDGDRRALPTRWYFRPSQPRLLYPQEEVFNMDRKRATTVFGVVIGMIMVGAMAGDVVAAERTTLGEFFTAPN